MPAQHTHMLPPDHTHTILSLFTRTHTHSSPTRCSRRRFQRVPADPWHPHLRRHPRVRTRASAVMPRARWMLIHYRQQAMAYRADVLLAGRRPLGRQAGAPPDPPAPHPSPTLRARLQSVAWLLRRTLGWLQGWHAFSALMCAGRGCADLWPRAKMGACAHCRRLF